MDNKMVIAKKCDRKKQTTLVHRPTHDTEVCSRGFTLEPFAKCGKDG